jgi:hypothetical protein
MTDHAVNINKMKKNMIRDGWLIVANAVLTPGQPLNIKLLRAATVAVAPLIRGHALAALPQKTPTIAEIERAICCPSGTCTSPTACYAEDRTRSYPVQLQDAAKAVAKLYRGD